MTKVAIRSAPVRATHFSKYLNHHETALLVHLVASVSPRVMIEFGCNLGVTAKRVLDSVPTLERYIGIDVPASFVPRLNCQLDEVPENAGAYAADDERFSLLLSSSDDLKAAQLEPCDAVFIDGDHSEFAVSYESAMARELVRPGGIIVWHDYGNPSVEVTRTLDRLCSSGWPIQSVEGSWLAFMRA